MGKLTNDTDDDENDKLIVVKLLDTNRNLAKPIWSSSSITNCSSSSWQV